MPKKDSNLKVGKQTQRQVRDQQQPPRGGEAHKEHADAPEAFRHQNERERKRPEVNHSQQGTDKAPESGTER